jgi:hypothetical protein
MEERKGGTGEIFRKNEEVSSRRRGELRNSRLPVRLE